MAARHARCIPLDEPNVEHDRRRSSAEESAAIGHARDSMSHAQGHRRERFALQTIAGPRLSTTGIARHRGATGKRRPPRHHRRPALAESSSPL